MASVDAGDTTGLAHALAVNHLGAESMDAVRSLVGYVPKPLGEPCPL
jgi:hypothetical protein